MTLNELFERYLDALGQLRNAEQDYHMLLGVLHQRLGRPPMLDEMKGAEWSAVQVARGAYRDAEHALGAAIRGAS